MTRQINPGLGPSPKYPLNLCTFTSHLLQTPPLWAAVFYVSTFMGALWLFHPPILFAPSPLVTSFWPLSRPVLNWNPSSHMDALFPTGKRLTLSLVKGSYNWFFLSCSLVLKKTEHFIYLLLSLNLGWLNLAQGRKSFLDLGWNSELWENSELDYQLPCFTCHLTNQKDLGGRNS